MQQQHTDDSRSTPKAKTSAGREGEPSAQTSGARWVAAPWGRVSAAERPVSMRREKP